MMRHPTFRRNPHLVRRRWFRTVIPTAAALWRTYTSPAAADLRCSAHFSLPVFNEW